MSIITELRTFRFMQVGLIASIPMFWFVVLNIPHQTVSPINTSQGLVIGLALWQAFGGLHLRAKLLRDAIPALQRNRNDAKALRQWRAAQVVPMASAEAVAIWGVFIRLGLNGSLRSMFVLSCVAIVLLLIWTPRLPHELRQMLPEH